MICTGSFSEVVEHEVKTGTTENGSSLFNPPVNIAGKIVKKQMSNIFGENEAFKFITFFYPVAGFVVNIGDKINGCEVVESLYRNKFLLK